MISNKLKISLLTIPALLGSIFFSSCKNEEPVTLTPHKGKGPSRNKVSPKGCLDLPALLKEYSGTTKSIAHLEDIQVQQGASESASSSDIFLHLLKADPALLREGVSQEELALWNVSQIQQKDCESIQIPNIMGNEAWGGEYDIATKTKDQLVLNKGRFSDTEILIDHQTGAGSIFVQVSKVEKFTVCDKEVEAKVTRSYNLIFDERKIKEQEIMMSSSLIDIYAALINNSPLESAPNELSDLAKKSDKERVELEELRPAIEKVKNLKEKCN